MTEKLVKTAEQFLSSQYGLTDVSITWERPQDAQHGDLATPVCLQRAKELGANPQEVAEALSAVLAELDEVAKAEKAGPGYVNVWLTSDALMASLASVTQASTPRMLRNDERPVIIEYSQPNIAKPLGVHHLLTTVIGQALVNLYRHAGYNVIAWNYVGDWGTQFGKLAVAVDLWGPKEDARDYTLDELLNLYVRFHNEAEQDPSLEEKGRDAFRKLEEGDEGLRTFRTAVIATTKEALADVYEQMHVSFDTDKGESFYEDKMDPILEQGTKKGVFVEGEGGALIVEFPEETGMPVYMVRKSDGATLYSTRDIAQMRYRIDTYDPQSILIVTDIAQKLHFEQLVATCERLQWDLPHFENVLVGRMRFRDQKMSTRKGSVMKLEDVLVEAVERADAIIAAHGDDVQTDDRSALARTMGSGAVAYGILSQNRKQDLIFDWETFLNFDGNSAPYLQYTHARARSVLRKAEQDSVEVPQGVSSLSDRERQLVNTLLQFSAVLEEARASHMPHILTNYLFNLCQTYNTFYNAEPILTAEENARTLRLALTSLTAEVLKTGAELLTLRVPDRM